MFELGKTLNVDKKSFVLVGNEFWGCVGLIFKEYCWFYWFYVMFVRGKCWVVKGNVVNICQNPCSFFDYRLSYNHPH